jgi:GTP-binding protein
MIIKTAKYIISSPSYELCPEVSVPEFAFIGRSNVGKSSLINYLTDNGSLAKVSKVPGKTKLINHFLINNEWFLVDLPGYGYAKTSKENRAKWGAFIEDYILKRENLTNLFVLVDGRIPPQTIDIEFIAWLKLNKIPMTIIITKTDKVSKNELDKFITLYTRTLKSSRITDIEMMASTSIKKQGKDDILELIENMLQE